MDAILTKPRHFDFLRAHAPRARLVTTMDEIADGGDRLIAYATGVIVPTEVLARWSWCYNFHPAPPSYPGRDPHHWACYDGARVYGATAHVMSPKVDEGEIVGALLMGMPKDCTPAMYHETAERCAAQLFAALAPLMLDCGVPPNGMTWSGIKRCRADAVAMARMTGGSEFEAYRRDEAFGAFRHAASNISISPTARYVSSGILNLQ